jgi:signal transduction histidine kinase
MGTSPAAGGRSEGEEERHRELEHVVSSLQATTAIAQALGGETDLDVVLDLIARRGRELVDARWAAIMILDGEDLELRATAGDTELRPIGHRYRADDTLAGQTLHSGRPRTVTDLSRHSNEEDRALVEALGAEHALLVPLQFRGQSVGVLMVAAHLPDGDGFSIDQEQLLEAFAASAATAVATAQSVAADRLGQSVAAAERERRRWARELHDETLQELGAAMLLIDTARGRGERDLRDALERVAESLAGTIAGLRRMIAELRPATLDQLGVAAAIAALADHRRGERLDVAVTIDLDHEEGRAATRLAPEVESTVYRIVQEALTNVEKHARAACARVEISERNGRVTVIVSDDGRGLGSSSNTSGTGLGLAGMRERVTLLGGAISIEATPGGGTVVRATIPALHL